MAASRALPSKFSTSLRLLLRQPVAVAAFTRTSKLQYVVNEKLKLAGKNGGELSFFGHEVWPALYHHQQFVAPESADRNRRKVDSDVDDDDADYKDLDVGDSDDDFDDIASGDDLFDSDEDSFSD